MQSSLHKTFFLLVKAGLFANTDFEREEPKDCGPVDWYKVWELAQEQSVQGLVLAGIETIFSNSHRLIRYSAGFVATMDRRNTSARAAQ